MLKHLNITVQGRVQGVTFRYSAKVQADNLGIKGLIQNRPDGTVYLEAEGTQESLDQFLEWCKKGPKLAEITRVEITPGELKNFKQFLLD